MHGEVICVVVDTFIPEDADFAEELFVAQPVELHVPGFGFLSAERFLNKSTGGVIIGLEGCQGLRMADGFQEKTNVQDGLGIVKKKFFR